VICWSGSPNNGGLPNGRRGLSDATPPDRQVRWYAGVRDKNAVEAAVFRPQTGYYNSLEEEAAALMESLGNNHGFLDSNKRIAFTATDVFLRRNGFCIEVDAQAGHEFIYGSMDRREFRFPKILDWIREHIKPLR
jgi:death-on-curing protein